MVVKKLNKGTTLLKRTAEEVKNYRLYKRIIPIIMAAIAVFIVLVYVIAVMYTRFGSFSVSVNKYHSLKYGLSLSENADFIKPTSHLDCHASEEITNIDGASLDDLKLGSIDGADSGENYLCYSFYCKNAGTEIVSYEYSINIANMTMGVEKAVRVRLTSNVNGVNGNTVDYARAKGVDKNGNSIPEENTVAFYNKNMIMQDTVRDFAPGDISRYTVVIWLEGNDDDCIDDIIGGSFKIDMKFSVISVADVLI